MAKGKDLSYCKKRQIMMAKEFRVKAFHARLARWSLFVVISMYHRMLQTTEHKCVDQSSTIDERGER